VPRLHQRMLDCPDQQAADQLRITKAHIGFGRMHVDVNQSRIQVDKKNHHRVTVARENVCISPAQSGQKKLVLHRPAIDEKELMLGIAPVMSGQTSITGEPDPFPRRINLHGVVDKIGPQNLRDPGQVRLVSARCGPGLRLAVGTGQENPICG
jgi:hypothetical protein